MAGGSAIYELLRKEAEAKTIDLRSLIDGPLWWYLPCSWIANNAWLSSVLVRMTEWARQWVRKASQHQISHYHTPNYYHIYYIFITFTQWYWRIRTLMVKPREYGWDVVLVPTTSWNELKHFVLYYVLWPSSTSVMSRTLPLPLALHTVTSWVCRALGRQDTLFKADLASALYAAVIRKSVLLLRSCL